MVGDSAGEEEEVVVTDDCDSSLDEVVRSVGEEVELVGVGAGELDSSTG